MAKFAINLKDGSLDYNQETIVGIDLGTTNSLVAYMQDGSPLCIRDANDKTALVPSIVHFSSEGNVLVGDNARERLANDPTNTIYSVKRLMGKSYKDIASIQQHYGYTIIDDDQDALVKIKVKDKYYSPVELSALILTELKQRAESHLHAKVTKAVITVPAYFNDNQRQSTRNAGKLAGLDVLRIVNEPTAAALAYGIGLKPEEAETVAVYDLGGGTFDISILRIEEGIFEVLSTHGDTFLGGDDIDRAIVDFWLAQQNVPATQMEDKRFIQILRLLAERAKKTVASGHTFQDNYANLPWQLDKSELDQLVQPLLDKTLTACKRALLDASLTTSEIDKIIMVGGSTRLPFIKEGVAAFFGKPLIDSLNPDEVVALGAAVQADILAGNQKDLLLLDITPLSLGIETVGGLMDVIIPRNNKVPSKAGRQYTTSIDGQTKLKVAIYQGERDAVEHNRKLGEFVLKGIPPMPAGLPKIDIQFLIDADGILTVIAQELRSGLKQQVVMRPTFGITEEQMALMLLESIQNAEQDVKFRGLAEARNEGNNILLAGEKFLQQNDAILSLAEKETTAQVLAHLRAMVQLTDKDAINAAIERVNTYTLPLAHRALDYSIGEALQGKKV